MPEVDSAAVGLRLAEEIALRIARGDGRASGLEREVVVSGVIDATGVTEQIVRTVDVCELRVGGEAVLVEPQVEEPVAPRVVDGRAVAGEVAGAGDVDVVVVDDEPSVRVVRDGQSRAGADDD